MDLKLFFSWQSDSDTKKLQQRIFIKECIQTAIKNINNVSSTKSEQCELCINSPLYIDARLLWKQTIGSNCP